VTAASRNQSLFVGFSGPSNNGGSAVFSYTASCVSSNGGASGSATGSGSPIIVNGLTNGRTYTCRVTATNSAGTGPQSAASNTAVPALAVPDPPVGVGATSRNLSLLVTFSPPANNGGSAITGYDVTCESATGVDGSASGTGSPIIVDDLTNGAAYTCTATATNALGTSAPSLASFPRVPAKTRPDPPTGVTATSRNLSLSVGFIPPANNGGYTITSYRATCTSSNGGTTGTASGGASRIIVNGLTNGRTYTCRVTATSEHPDPGSRTSANSAASNTAVPAVTVPDPPRSVVADGGNSSIRVTFAAPANNGGSAITSYTARCVSSDGGTTGVGSGPSSPVVVPAVTNGRTYTCTVRATSVQGTSAWSTASLPTRVNTVPDAPAIGVVTSRNTSLKVRFSEPTDNGGAGIQFFTASCTSSNGGASGSATGGDSPIIVDGLTNGRTYTCRVTATNVLGTGAPSAASNTAVPAVTVPDPPTIISTIGRNAQMSVSFVPPANNGGSTITSYEATCESPDGGAPGSAVGTTSPLVVSPLTNGAFYSCVMTATSALGTSELSRETGLTLVAAVPDAPTLTRVAVNADSLRVSFSPPADNGGSAITSYAAYCTSENGGVARRRTGATSPILVTGLTTGQPYTCSVTARNSFGAGGASDNSTPVFVGAPKAPALVAAASLPVSATSLTGSLRVTFVPRSDNGSEVFRYTAFCISTTLDDLRSARVAGPDAAPIIVRNLTRGKTYVCKVRATNDRGPGVLSSATAPVTVGAPAAPTSVKAVRSAAGQLTVTFKAGANNGAAVFSYTVTCESDDGGVDAVVVTGTMSAVVAGLTVGKPYSCSVVANNSRGGSPPSAWSTPVLV
jgi:hypothetical protein